jgi:hypothetical protein
MRKRVGRVRVKRKKKEEEETAIMLVISCHYVC